MRTPILAAALGLSLVGCLVGDSGAPGTAGDDDGSSTGSNNNGSGTNPTPKLDVSVDHPTLSTELLSTNMVTVTLKSSGGFTGPVTLAASAVDSTSGAALTGWTVALDKTTVDLAAGATATAVATLKIPSQSAAMSGSIKIDATSSLGPQSVASTVTVANQLSLKMTLAGTTCAQSSNPALTISQGTKVIWMNGDTTKRVTIHVEPGGGTTGIKGVAHEPDPGMAPAGMAGDTYEQTVQGAGTITWYCHAPGTDKNRYTITAAP